MKATIAYAGEGKSVFDFFFLAHFLKKNRVYLLTFSGEPYLVPKGVRVSRIHQPLQPSVSPLTGVYAYGTSLLRSILLKRQLKNVKADALISSGAVTYGFYGALSNFRPNILLVWGSDVLIAPKSLPFRFIAKYSLRKATAVVADSEAEESACVSLGYDPKKIVKFPWVDLQPFMPGSIGENTQLLKRRMGWSENDLVVVSTRHHEPVYDVESLIQTIPYVTKEVQNVRFLVLGEGSLTRNLKELVRKLNVEDKVKFLGRVPYVEIPKYLAMSDIYVSTSLSDGTSASLLEAMASRLPSAVTSIPANREWVEDGKSGILVPCRDPEGLAGGLIKLLKDEKLRKRLGMNAYKTVLEKADWQENSKLLDDLIDSMFRLKK